MNFFATLSSASERSVPCGQVKAGPLRKRAKLLGRFLFIYRYSSAFQAAICSAGAKKSPETLGFQGFRKIAAGHCGRSSEISSLRRTAVVGAGLKGRRRDELRGMLGIFGGFG